MNNTNKVNSYTLENKKKIRILGMRYRIDFFFREGEGHEGDYSFSV